MSSSLGVERVVEEFETDFETHVGECLNLNLQWFREIREVSSHERISSTEKQEEQRKREPVLSLL